MFRFGFLVIAGLMGLTPAAMAQEVTASGTYKAQDYALSRRVEVLRAVLDATVQQVQKITTCNAKGMVYVSSTVVGATVDADGCASTSGTPECMRVYNGLSEDNSGSLSSMFMPDEFRIQTTSYGFFNRTADFNAYKAKGQSASFPCIDVNACRQNMHAAGLFHISEVPAGFVKTGISDGAYIGHKSSTDTHTASGYYVDLYCKVKMINP